MRQRSVGKVPQRPFEGDRLVDDRGQGPASRGVVVAEESFSRPSGAPSLMSASLFGVGRATTPTSAAFDETVNRPRTSSCPSLRSRSGSTLGSGRPTACLTAGSRMANCIIPYPGEEQAIGTGSVAYLGTSLRIARTPARKRSTSSSGARPRWTSRASACIDPDTIIRVGAGAKRKIMPGDQGVRLLALGGTPGELYEAAEVTQLGTPDPLAKLAVDGHHPDGS